MDFTEDKHILLPHQAHVRSATDTWIVGAEFNVADWMFGVWYMFLGNLDGSTQSTGVKCILEGRPELGGAGVNSHWSPLRILQGSTSAKEGVAIAAAGAAQGVKEIPVKTDPTSKYLSGSEIYIRDVSDITGGEWHVVDYSTASPDKVFLRDGLDAAKVEDDALDTQANMWACAVELGGVARARALVHHPAVSGSNIHVHSILRAVTDIE